MIMFVNKFVDVLTIKRLVKLLLLTGEEPNRNTAWIIHETVDISLILPRLFQ